ncbi:class I SAM-dependent methyltransferase [Lewinella sp. JB7]|nr:class I SAM-dependent methyltransferase [Lewinella sp. JB7]
MNGIGAATVRKWSEALPQQASVLDLGCGTGIPISGVLVDRGIAVYGIDASPALLAAFRENFPTLPAACERVEESTFFGRRFDAIVAIGLVFLLSEESQEALIRKAADHLLSGGRLLFTAPASEVEWEDTLTGRRSASLGAKRYRTLLADAGFSLLAEYTDAGDNHYYDAVKA